MKISTIVVLVLSFLLIANQFDISEANNHVNGRQKGGNGRNSNDYNRQNSGKGEIYSVLIVSTI